MSDLQLLMVALAVVYCSECIYWVRRGAVVIRSFLPGRFSVAHPATALIGNQFGGTCLSNPLPPLGLSYVCHVWPFCADEQSIWSLAPCTVDPAGRPDHPLVKIRFDAIASVSSSRGEILINGRSFLWLDDEVAAAFFSSVIRNLRDATANERQEVITNAMASTFHMPAIAARVHQLELLTSRMMVHCHAMAVVLAVGLPLVIGSHHVRPFWPLLLAVFVGLQLTILRGFYVAHGALMPEARRYRARALSVMALTPTASIRARDFLARQLLSSFNPLAVATVLCTEGEAGPWVRRLVNDARHPIESGEEDTSLRIALHSTAGQLRDQMIRTLKARGWQTMAASVLAVRESDSESYCPRCETQYRVAGGTCSTCGVPLHPFDEQQTRAPGGIGR